MRSKTDDTMKLDEDYVHDVHDLTAEDVERLKDRKPRTLGIRCRRTDCAQDLHCFDPIGRKKPKYPVGRCQYCGADLIKWDRMWLRDTRDVEAKFAFFKREWIRHFFFHVPIPPRVENHARTSGIEGLASMLEAQLRSGTMIRFTYPLYDRLQTEMLKGNIVHWARHAVGSCCRQCMCYWHNVPLDQELTNEDVKYFTELGMRFILTRIPDLGGGPKMMPRPESANKKLKAN